MLGCNDSNTDYLRISAIVVSVTASTLYSQPSQRVVQVPLLLSAKKNEAFPELGVPFGVHIIRTLVF